MTLCHSSNKGITFDQVNPVRVNNQQFGSSSEAIIYPLLLLVVMWLVYWGDHLFPFVQFYKFGLIPGDFSTLRGVLFMPLIHSKSGFEHILNNSLPTAILLAAIVFYYRKIALKVFAISWLATGIGLWLFATNNNSYHIGMSGVIYAMAGFVFTSGVIRKYLPLQAISLFVAFIYGSMIWGIFPTEAHVSWEGHLSGLVVGIALAFIYRKQGPQSPKYMYEIEKEMGIEPPDLEGIWREKVAREKERQEQLAEARKNIAAQIEESRNNPTSKSEVIQNPKAERSDPLRVIYHYQPKKKPSDDNDQQ